MIIHTEYYILWVSADFQSFIYIWIDDTVIHKSCRFITLAGILETVLSFCSLLPILLILRTAVNSLYCFSGYRTRRAASLDNNIKVNYSGTRWTDQIVQLFFLSVQHCL